MSQSRAIRSAFSEVFRDPVIYLAELMWRSVLCGIVTLLCAYAAIAYLHSLEVTDLDLWGLSGIVPGTATAALQHIFQGSGPALVRATAAAGCGALLLWWAVATLGRTATLASLVRSLHLPLGTIAGLNMVRGIVTTLAAAAVIGAYALASSGAQITVGAQDRGKFYAILLPLVALIGWGWSSVSWYLRVAQIPAARQDRGLIAAVRSAGQIVRHHGSQFLWIGFVTGVVRAALFFVAMFFALFVLSLALQSPAALGLAIVLFYALLCLVAFTFIQVLQMAAYVRVFAWANANTGLE